MFWSNLKSKGSPNLPWCPGASYVAWESHSSHCPRVPGCACQRCILSCQIWGLTSFSSWLHGHPVLQWFQWSHISGGHFIQNLVCAVPKETDFQVQCTCHCIQPALPIIMVWFLDNTEGRFSHLLSVAIRSASQRVSSPQETCGESILKRFFLKPYTS